MQGRALSPGRENAQSRRVQLSELGGDGAIERFDTRGSGTYGRVCVRVRLQLRLGCAATFAKRLISRSRRRRAEAAHLDIQ